MAFSTAPLVRRQRFCPSTVAAALMTENRRSIDPLFPGGCPREYEAEKPGMSYARLLPCTRILLAEGDEDRSPDGEDRAYGLKDPLIEDGDEFFQPEPQEEQDGQPIGDNR
jgi:hypothetical protein